MKKFNENNLDRMKAVLEARDLLEKAWLKIYEVSEGEMTGKFHDLRQAINSASVRATEAKNELKEEMK